MNLESRILIVEDKSRMRELLASELREEEKSWDVLTAAKPSEAITILEREAKLKRPIAVMITDFDLKEKDDGLTLIRFLQQLDPLAMSILYTGFPAKLRENDLTGLGIVDVIIKAGGAEATFNKILDRTREALRYRRWAVTASFLRRYFDPKFFEVIQKDSTLLLPTNRTVTIAFWDIRAFSALCTALREEPDRIAAFLRDYYEMVARTVFEHDGLLDKFIGDGVMALFGVIHQDDSGRKVAAAQAVQAGRVICERFSMLKKSWLPRFESCTTETISIDIACGIHTGRALVGNLGTELRDQFTAVGPNVNFAQRLESLAGKADGGAILISQPTYSHIRSGNDFTVTLFGEISDVKNVPGTHKIYAVAV
jgi:adenylate cyclase